MIDWPEICLQIAQHSGNSIAYRSSQPVGGGCINSCYRLKTDQEAYFIKLNAIEQRSMFAEEMAGLEEISGSRTIRTPTPVTHGQTAHHSFLALEFIPLIGASSEVQAGQRLASMHQKQEQLFGWQRDNYIGLTPQYNKTAKSWSEFWRDQRLRPQLQLAATRGYNRGIQTAGEELARQLPQLLNHSPTPSLLHGDLWSGNIGYDNLQNPVIFDPAVYYGDRETDIAMSELFGGFGDRFYAAYNEAWPLDSGYKTRKIVYNLYHILNHLNLFGGGYLHQAESMIKQLLAETRD